MMDKKKVPENEPFETPKVEIIMFQTEDVITTSGGGFIGDWDNDLPQQEF